MLLAKAVLQRRERIVDDPETVAGPEACLGHDHRSGDHGPDGALVGLNMAQEPFGGHPDPLHGVGAVLGGGQCLLRAWPGAIEGLSQKRHQVGKIPVGGRLRDQRRPGDGGHGDLRAAGDEVTRRSDDGSPGALLLKNPATRGVRSHLPTLPGRAHSVKSTLIMRVHLHELADWANVLVRVHYHDGWRVCYEYRYGAA